MQRPSMQKGETAGRARKNNEQALSQARTSRTSAPPLFCPWPWRRLAKRNAYPAQLLGRCRFPR
eukprot:12318266-Alexandrium_andersonii.AAC.1